MVAADGLCEQSYSDENVLSCMSTQLNEWNIVVAEAHLTGELTPESQSLDHAEAKREDAV